MAIFRVFGKISKIAPMALGYCQLLSFLTDTVTAILVVRRGATDYEPSSPCIFMSSVMVTTSQVQASILFYIPPWGWGGISVWRWGIKSKTEKRGKKKIWVK